MTATLGPFSLERMERAAERVGERLVEAARAFDTAGIPYAVTGGVAVGLWIAKADPAAVRNTPDVDIIIQHDDFEAARNALGAAGFSHKSVSDQERFLDSPTGSIRGGVHLVFEGEGNERLPGVHESELFRVASEVSANVVNLGALIRGLLASFRTIDRVHLADLIEVGLIDETWCDRYPPELGARLKHLIDTPEG
jgi:hypothetical protein